MRDKILAKLAVKYPGLSKQFLGLWADKLTAKVTEETQIEGVVNELDNLPVTLTDLAAEWQKEGDRRVTEAEKKWKQDKPAPKTDPEPPKPKEKEEGDIPAWANAMLQELKDLKKERVTATISEKVAKHDKLRDIHPTFYKGRTLPEKEEDIDGFIDAVISDHTAYQQELVNQGLVTATKPAGGTPSTTSVDADIDAWVDKNKKQETSKK